MRARREFWIGAQARQQFEAALAHWRAQRQHPSMLHAVCITPSEAPFTHQRTAFDGGCALLTECSGPMSHALREIGGWADRITLAIPGSHGPASTWDSYSFKALARLCKRGTQLRTVGGSASLPDRWVALLKSNGFVLQAVSDQFSDFLFAPRWPIQEARAAAPGRCVIIGAGLAGAAVAASLARRGWQVTAIDASGPASGASGVPVGLMAPHISKDDALLSRISRIGTLATWAQVQALLRRGQDWQRSGSLQRHLTKGADVWHEGGGWIKPASLVRAWLEQPGITILRDCKVHQLLQTNAANGTAEADQWHALGEPGQRLASGSLVVLAAGFGSIELLGNAGASLLTPAEHLQKGRMPALQAVRGQVSMGHYVATDPLAGMLPSWPLHGHGSLIPAVTDGDRLQWVCGATFQRDDLDLAVRQSDHEINLGRLHSLLPESGAALAQHLRQSSPLRPSAAWVGVRCASVDRLPLVGPLVAGQRAAAQTHSAKPAQGLWLCTALGSRGLSYAALCAELLAAKLHGEPLPLPVSLAKCLAADR